MSKPGLPNIILGLIWITGGGLVTVLTHALAPEGYYLITLGLVFVGAIQLLWGLWQFLSFQFKSPEDKARYRAEIELRALVRSMVAMASADGVLHDAEVKTISRIYQNLMDHPLERATIAKVQKTMRGEKYSIYDDLAMTQAQISDSMKDNIIRACYYVMVADDDISESERERISEIAATLHVPVEHAIELVEEIRSKPSAKPKLN